MTTVCLWLTFVRIGKNIQAFVFVNCINKSLGFVIKHLVCYCCTGPIQTESNKSLINVIESVRRRAARFIKGDYDRDSSVTGMLKSINLDRIPSTRQAKNSFLRKILILIILLFNLVRGVRMIIIILVLSKNN
jgi:hypothetical protein